MHHGVYEGIAAAAQRKRVLILCESHHDIDPSKSTQKVMEEYIAGAHSHTFSQIPPAFGVDTGEGRDMERALFWDKVYFGNYIDTPLVSRSGEGDQTAKNLATQNKATYNRELAEFVNLHQINTIFCFGLQNVFDHLPGNHYAGILHGENGETIDGKKLGENKGLEIAGYLCEWELFDHPVRIYGMTHPAYQGGFSPKPFVEYLKPAFEDCCG